MIRILRPLLLCVLLAALAACTPSGMATGKRAGSSPAETILVLGASGHTGQYVIRQLAAEGRSFRALTSNVEKAREKVGADYPWVQGDVRDPATLEPLFAGVTTIISALGATEFKGPNGPEFVDYEGVRNVVDIAKRSKVRQIVLMSAAGVTVKDHPLNRMGNVMVWKLKGEDYLRNSGIPYTIVRPGGLRDTEAGTTGILFTQGDNVIGFASPQSQTSRGELAAIFIAALDDPDARFKTIEAFNEPKAAPGNWRTGFRDMVTDAR
jgi:uncharacterized protein YbjT (DUF2867 family)